MPLIPYHQHGNAPCGKAIITNLGTIRTMHHHDTREIHTTGATRHISTIKICLHCPSRVTCPHSHRGTLETWSERGRPGGRDSCVCWQTVGVPSDARRVECLPDNVPIQSAYTIPCSFPVFLGEVVFPIESFLGARFISHCQPLSICTHSQSLGSHCSHFSGHSVATRRGALGHLPWYACIPTRWSSPFIFIPRSTANSLIADSTNRFFYPSLYPHVA